ncbi:MAG: VanZ family protein [bacterium]|nr:VanZ family protein [bacterium]
MARPFALAAFLWAAAILVGSVTPHVPAAFALFAHEDKVLHFVEFALLSFLVYKAFIHSSDIRLARRALRIALLLGLVYAAAIEVVQDFLPNRECSLADLAAGWAGVALVVLLARQRGALRTGRERGRDRGGGS